MSRTKRVPVKRGRTSRHSGVPWSTQRSNTSSCSAGQAPSHGIVPSCSFAPDGRRVGHDVVVEPEVEGPTHRITVLLAEQRPDVGAKVTEARTADGLPDAAALIGHVQRDLAGHPTKLAAHGFSVRAQFWSQREPGVPTTPFLGRHQI